MGEGFLSAACHYSEVYDSASDLLGFQSTVYCTVDKRMHVHPGIESGPYALSSLVIFFILSSLGAAITLRLVGSRNVGSGKAASGGNFVSAVEWT